jgi:hypothetical protein
LTNDFKLTILQRSSGTLNEVTSLRGDQILQRSSGTLNEVTSLRGDQILIQIVFF